MTSAAKASVRKNPSPAVERDDLRNRAVIERAGERDRGERAERGAAQGHAGRADRDDRQQARDRRPEPRRPFVHAERAEGGGRHPVLERRLLEILEAVQARRHPVAAKRHFARDLTVAAFVRVKQAVAAEVREPHRDDRERDRRENGARGEERGCRHRNGGRARGRPGGPRGERPIVPWQGHRLDGHRASPPRLRLTGATRRVAGASRVGYDAA